ncbi:MAG: HSP90 family protein [Opitutaceae bacterium]
MNNSENFQVNLRGLITLLSNNLYSSPRVYIRELLQNSVDAIKARTLSDNAQSFSPVITVQVSQDDPTRVTVTDNGVGLNREEIKQFLSTIGDSSKQEELSIIRKDFIGQFGIGLLSCFMVTDEITITTKSEKAPQTTLTWIGNVDGSYKIQECETDIETGTQVTFRVRDDFEHFASPEFLNETIKEYGLLLPHPIFLQTDVLETQLTLTNIPWRSSGDTASVVDESLLKLGESLFDEAFLFGFPFSSEFAEGVIYIRKHTNSSIQRSAHRVYVKGMLVTSHSEEILPDWAFFVKAIVFSNHLDLTASRETLREGEKLDQAQSAIGELIKSKIKSLSHDQPDLINQILENHQLAIKAMALDDDEFCKTFIDWISFRTTLGIIPFSRLRTLPKVYLAQSLESFQQIAQIAAAQGICVVNGGYIYDSPLLVVASQVIDGFQCDEIDYEDFFEQFEELDLDERDDSFLLLNSANDLLKKYDCYCDSRKFLPESVPVTYVINEEARLLRHTQEAQAEADDLFSDLLASVTSEATLSASSTLYFNYNNELVQKLIKIRSTEKLIPIIEVLYVQSLLLGQHTMSESEYALLNSSLTNLVNQSLQC